jgi:hypothetical protein
MITKFSASMSPSTGDGNNSFGQYGTCFLWLTMENMLARVYRKLGLNSENENRIQFYIDQETTRQAVGLPSSLGSISPEISAVANLIIPMASDDLEYKTFLDGRAIFRHTSFDYEFHLTMVQIFLFAELGMLTPELGEAAAKGSERWHSEAVRVGHNVENLFYQYLANYTGAGDQGEFARIADKLLIKMDCWDSPIDSDSKLKKFWQTELKHPTGFNGRKGWSFQRSPKAIQGDVTEKTRTFEHQASNPFGHDLTTDDGIFKFKCSDTIQGIE